MYICFSETFEIKMIKTEIVIYNKTNYDLLYKNYYIFNNETLKVKTFKAES